MLWMPGSRLGWKTGGLGESGEWFMIKAGAFGGLEGKWEAGKAQV